MGRGWIFIYLLWYITMGFIIISVVDYMYTHSHEYAHKAIADNHGCVDSIIEVNYLTGGSFLCTEYVDRSDNVILQEKMLHSQNEIFGYHLFYVILSILISGLLIGFPIFLKRFEVE